MPLDAEQRKHLQQSWLNIHLRANETAAQHERELLYQAHRKNNSAVIPSAYSEAALHRLEISVRDQLDWTINELCAMDILIDDETEKFIVEHFNSLTSHSVPLNFSPGLTATMNVAPYQGEHSRASMRLNNQLQREAASAIKSLKFKTRSNVQHTTAVFNNSFYDSPNARIYYQSTDNSVNHK